MTAAPYHWQRSGRSNGTAITVALIWLALAVAYVFLDASIWLVWILALFTLPAVYDLMTGRVSEMHVTEDGLRWKSGGREDHASWAEVDRVRLDTRLDFSVRTSIIVRSGRRVRLPIDVTPPAEQFEAALRAHGANVRRHHFSLIG